MFLMASPAAAERLSVVFHPENGPLGSVGCTVNLVGAELKVAEFVGFTSAPQGPLRWIASRHEKAMLRAALHDLQSGDLPASDPTDARSRRPPFLEIHWSSPDSDGLRAGYYQQRDLILPEAVRQMLRVVAPGSSCSRFSE